MTKQLLKLNKQGDRLVIEVLEVSPREGEIIAMYCKLRNKYFELHHLEEIGDENTPGVRSELFDLYNSFTQLYGRLSKTRTKNILLQDPYGFLICSSLEYKQGTEFFPADVLIRSPRGEVEVFKTNSVQDALSYVLGMRGKVDIEEISNITDKEISEVLTELGDLVYLNCESKEWETTDKYLSNNVYQKLLQAKYAVSQHPENEQFQRSLKVIEEIQPNKIPFELLSEHMNFGERWIPVDMFMSFGEELFESKTLVTHFTGVDKYKVESKGVWSRKAYNEYFVRSAKSRSTVNGYELLEHALENTCPKFSYTVGTGDDKVTIYDADAVQLANEKIESIRSEFVNWLYRLPQEEKDKLVDLYNNLYNCYVIRKYNGSHLQLPGIDLSKLGKNETPIELYKSQKDTAWRIIQDTGAIVDHEVGSGKSLICVIAAHEMKRMGIRTKPAILCLKANVQEIVKTYRLAYPSAKVLAPGEGDFEKNNRVRLFHEMKNNDWDCIIMTHDQFGKINQDPEIEAEIMQEEIDMIEEDLNTLQKCGYQVSRQMKKGLEKRKQNALVALKKKRDQIGSKKDEDINFTDIGIDHMLIDECFPYETPILTNLGWLSIGEIVSERKEVFVLSFCTESCIFELMPVTNWLKKPLVKKLVTVTHEYGEITCTEDHKIWTNECGYIKAGQLTPEHTFTFTSMSNLWEGTEFQTVEVLQSEMCSSKSKTGRMEMASTKSARTYADLSMVQNSIGDNSKKQVLQHNLQNETSEQFTSYQGTETRVWENIFKIPGRREEKSEMFRENEVKQSNAQSRIISKDDCKYAREEVCITRGKWTIDRSTNSSLSSIKTIRQEYGMGNKNETCSGRLFFSPLLLQSRYCNTGTNVMYRSGWEIPSDKKRENSRQFENESIGISRVVSVKIYERGSDAGFGFSNSDSDFVYDLTIEKNHNYFAAGVLVSNCHRFKNLSFTTRHDRVAGLGNQQGSQKATNMLYAIRTLQKRFNNDLQVTFLSGTPISNSLTEMYLLFKYLRPRELARQNITNFDAWAAVFAKKTTDFEFSVTNQIIAKERFRHFIKVPELALFYNEIADFRTKKMINIEEPEMVEELVNLAPSEAQQEYITNLIKFAETGNGAYIDRPPLSDGEMSAKMLIATNLAKKMSTDMRLINPALYDDHPNNKVSVCTWKIKQFYDSSMEFKGTQLIFCDLGTPGTEGFNVYEELKRKLVEHSIPLDEITFIHQWNERNKHELFKKMNDGVIRVLIGSTDKAGTGLNVQQRVVAMHQLDIPWKPAELTQRVGRGVRPGNWGAKLYQDNKVYNFVYATERSLDTYKFTLLKNKQTFISQMKNNELQVRSIDEGSIDEQSGMNFAEYIAVLSGDNTLLEKAKIDKKLAVLENLRSVHYREISDNKYKLVHKKDRIQVVVPLISDLKRDNEQYETLLTRDETGTKENPIEIPAVQGIIDEENKKWEAIKKERKEVEAMEDLPKDEKRQLMKELRQREENIKDKPVIVGEFLMRYFKEFVGTSPERVGTLYGFDLWIEKAQVEIEEKSYASALYGSNSIIHKNKYFAQHPLYGIKYTYNHGVPNFSSPRICARIFLNSLERIEGLYETYTKEYEILVRDIEALENFEGKAFSKDGEIEFLRSESKRLQHEIQAKMSEKKEVVTSV